MKNVLNDQMNHSSFEQTTPKESNAKSSSQNAIESPMGPIQGLRIDNVLFCLDTGKEKYLFATEEEAIEQLRKLDKKEINPDNSQIAQVTATGTTWKLTQIPWSRIAIKLL